MTPALDITVYGEPGPQGSKRHVGNGRMVESSKKVAPWREMVRLMCVPFVQANEALDGPLRVEMTFTLAKPASAVRRRRTWPMRKPDLSKLVRSTEDALWQVGAIKDDSRIVELRTAKRFPGEGEDALVSMGCRIKIWRIEE